MSAGYRVGRYTQPHLIDWRERTWVDGRIIEPQEVVKLVERIKAPVEELHRGWGVGAHHLRDRHGYHSGLLRRPAGEVAVLRSGLGRLDASTR